MKNKSIDNKTDIDSQVVKRKKAIFKLAKSAFNDIKGDHNGSPKGSADYQQANRTIAIKDFDKIITANTLSNYLMSIGNDEKEGRVIIYTDNSFDKPKHGYLNLEYANLSGDNLPFFFGNNSNDIIQKPKGKDGGIMVISEFGSLLLEHKYDIENLIRKLIWNFGPTQDGFGSISTGWSLIFLCHNESELDFIASIRSIVFKDAVMWLDTYDYLPFA